MKKLLRNIGIIVAAICIIIFIGYKFLDWFNNTDQELMSSIKQLEASEAELFILGEIKTDKKIKFSYKAIDKISDENLTAKRSNTYHLIVINDLDGNVNISDEELLKIRDYCENKHYDFLYYGNSKKEQLLRCGFNLYEEAPFMYQGKIYKDKNAPVFNGTNWYDSETDTYYANPYFLAFSWTDSDTEKYKTDSSVLIESIVKMALVGLEY